MDFIFHLIYSSNLPLLKVKIRDQPDKTVDAGLQRTAGVASKHMDVESLQEVHQGCVHLRQETDGEDEREGQDESVHEISAYLEIRG